MGNCVRKDYDNQWGGDYWGSSPASSPESSLISRQRCHVDGDDESSGDRFCGSVGEPTTTTTTEVKIKITRKQLEELLCMKEVQGMTLEQVLTQLINGGDKVFDFHQRSWRPELHSIPE